MIAENLLQLRGKIEEACKKCGRNSDEIKLIAVSKYFGTDAILEAHKLGVKDFGENRAQELMLKYEKIGDSVVWHFIGTLQKNKVKFAVKCAEYIHSIDSVDLLDEVDKRAEKLNKVQKVLLEVKTSDEETKSGVETENEIFNLIEHSKNLKNVMVTGLMTIAPLTDNQNLIRKSFRDLAELKNKINAKGFNLTELSMGMTSDFEIAIEQGATMLRIGSAIFGERDYSKDWRIV